MKTTVISDFCQRQVSYCLICQETVTPPPPSLLCNVKRAVLGDKKRMFKQIMMNYEEGRGVRALHIHTWCERLLKYVVLICVSVM